jgi:hypothetical protein
MTAGLPTLMVMVGGVVGAVVEAEFDVTDSGVLVGAAGLG